MNREVETDKAPVPVGPYSQAVISSGMVYCSGQLGLDPKTGKLASSSAGAETIQALMNLRAVLEGSGSSLKNVVKVTIFITSMQDFKEVNEAYKQFFEKPFPSRTTVGVASLPLGARVEIDLIASIQ